MVKMNRRTTNAKNFLISAALIVSSNLERLRVYITEITIALVFHTLYNRGNTILRFTRAERLDSGCSSYLNDVLALDVVLACLLLIRIYNVSLV